MSPNLCQHPMVTMTEGELARCGICNKALTSEELTKAMMQFGIPVSTMYVEPCTHPRFDGTVSSPTCADCGATVFVNQVESITLSEDVDMVNHPPHYRSSATCSECGHPIQAIDVIRHVKDGRIYTAMKYLWRVGLGGGKADDVEDVGKAKWYLTDYEDHPVS